MGIPSKAMLITAAINIVLDPVLIFGLGPIPAFGIEGAGMASFIANILAVIYEFYMAGPRGYNFMPKPKRLCEKERAAFKQIFSIGLPSSVANALNPTAISLGNYYVAQTSVLAVAGFGVATKVQAFSMIPILALSSATGPLIGQNFAADKLDRVREILKYALGFSCLWFLIQALALYFFSYPISGVFTDQAEILQPSSMYLEIVGFSLLGYSFIIIANSAMNAVNKPIIGFSLILFRTLAVFIPSYYLYTSLNVASPVIWAYFTANFLSIFYALFSLRYFFSGKNI